MEPKVWGPGAWLFLHSITMNYPENPSETEKMYYKNFFLNLQNVLPCPSCAKHYSINLKKYPIDPALENRELFVKWLIDIHNEVNLMLGKKTYSYDEVYELYDDINSSNDNDNDNDTYDNGSNNITVVFLLILVCLIGYYYYKNYYRK